MESAMPDIDDVAESTDDDDPESVRYTPPRQGSCSVVLYGQHERHELCTSDPDEFPNVEEFTAKAYHELETDDMKTLIQRTVFAIDKDNPRYALGGVCFEGEEGPSGVTPTAAQVGRDVLDAANTASFWIIHALGAYEPAEFEDFDGEDLWTGGYATSISALIYNELIRDLISTSYWPGQPNNKRPWVAIAEARSRIMLHEASHYFLGGHGTPISDQGIMNTNWDLLNFYLYSGGTYVLEDEQIRKIQKQPKPAPYPNVV